MPRLDVLTALFSDTSQSQSRESIDGLDLDRLADYLTARMAVRDVSLCRGARAMGLSPATLSRLLMGSRSPTVPDTATLSKATSWLNCCLSDFETREASEKTTLETIEAQVRALEGASEKKASAMIAALREIYSGR